MAWAAPCGIGIDRRFMDADAHGDAAEPGAATGLGAGVTGLENAFLIVTGIFLLVWLFAVYHRDHLARVIEITPDESET